MSQVDSSWTVVQLREFARKQGISIPSSVTLKADLINFISKEVSANAKSRKQTDEKPKNSQSYSSTVVPDRVDDTFTVADMREIAQKAGISIPSSVRLKADIVNLINSELGKSKTKSSSAPAPSMPRIASTNTRIEVNEDDYTVPELKDLAAKRNVKIPSSVRLKSDIVDHINAQLKEEKRPENPNPKPKSVASSSTLNPKLILIRNEDELFDLADRATKKQRIFAVFSDGSSESQAAIKFFSEGIANLPNDIFVLIEKSMCPQTCRDYKVSKFPSFLVFDNDSEWLASREEIQLMFRGRDFEKADGVDLRENVNHKAEATWTHRKNRDLFTKKTRENMNSEEVDHIIEIQIINAAWSSAIKRGAVADRVRRDVNEKLAPIVNSVVNLNVTEGIVNQSKKGPFMTFLNCVRESKPFEDIESLARQSSSGNVLNLVDSGIWSNIEKAVCVSFDELFGVLSDGSMGNRYNADLKNNFIDELSILIESMKLR